MTVQPLSLSSSTSLKRSDLLYRIYRRSHQLLCLLERVASTEASSSLKQILSRPSPNRTHLPQRLSHQRPPRRHPPMQPLRLHRLWLRPRLREASPQPVSNSPAAPVPIFRPCLLITATLVAFQRRRQHRLVCSPCVRTHQEKGKGPDGTHSCWCHSCCIFSTSHD